MKKLTLDDIERLNRVLNSLQLKINECKEILRALNEVALANERGADCHGVVIQYSDHRALFSYEKALGKLTVCVFGILLFARCLKKNLRA